jgi:transcriptional regulator with XRE-family HTH domain
MKSADKVSNPRDIRHRLGLNQQEFWGAIGVTQSGGSRYESGRSMPRPVQQLLRLVHVDQIDIGKLHRTDMELVQYLKESRPALYRHLRTQIGSARGGSARKPATARRPAASSRSARAA